MPRICAICPTCWPSTTTGCRPILQAAPVRLRGLANATGTGNVRLDPQRAFNGLLAGPVDVRHQRTGQVVQLRPVLPGP